MSVLEQPTPSPRLADTTAIRVRGLTKEFTQGGFLSRRRFRAVNGVDFDIARGEIVALVGESGSGKSTIARMLARLEKPSAGELCVDGVNVLKAEPRHASRGYRGKVQMVFQDPFGSLNPVHRIEHFLTRALVRHGRADGRKATQAVLRELMATVGLPEQMLWSYPHQLSGGQRQRVAIARALAVEPEIILADEPTSMLDVSVRIGILNLMRRLRDERGISMLYITHDLASARYLADTTLVMYAGELVEGGDSVDVMANPQHPYTQLLLSAVPDPTRRVALDLQARARLRAEVLSPATCPHGSTAQPCSHVDPVRHPTGANHWVRCHLYRPSATAPANALVSVRAGKGR